MTGVATLLSVLARSSELKKHPLKNEAIIQFERLKASLRAKVEHPFRIIKCHWFRENAVQRAAEK